MVLLDGATSATPIDGAPSTGPNLPKRQKFKISQMFQNFKYKYGCGNRYDEYFQFECM